MIYGKGDDYSVQYERNKPVEIRSSHLSRNSVVNTNFLGGRQNLQGRSIVDSVRVQSNKSMLAHERGGSFATPAPKKQYMFESNNHL